MTRYRNRLSSNVLASSLLAVLLLPAAPVLARSVIVQLDGAPGARYVAQERAAGRTVSDEALEAYRSGLRADQDAFLEALDGLAVSYTLETVQVPDFEGNVTPIELRYTLVFNGMALDVPESEVQTIEQMPQVREVYPNRMLRLHLDQSVDYIRAPEVYGDVEELTPFDDFREGFEGQGMHLAVIDTGIEWFHEMFGLDPTPPRLGIAPAAQAVATNEKIIYNLPLADVFAEDGFGHGTHVGSTAAGYLGFAPGGDGLPNTDDDVAVHGVAPQARLLSYKVCSDVRSTVSSLLVSIGGCDTSVIILAIEDAVSPRTVNGLPKPVAHVINMSLGGAGGPDSPTAIASDNAVLAGTIVVASAGNSGPGAGTVGAPAAGRRVIAVGANTDPGSAASWSADVLDPLAIDPATTGAVVPARDLREAEDQRSGIRLFPMAGTPTPPSESMAQYFVFVRNGQTIDEWPVTAAGRIALVKLNDPRLPATTFAQIANNGFLAGAEAVVFLSTTQNPTAITAPIPAANIDPEDGEYLISLIPSAEGEDPENGEVSDFPIRLNPFLTLEFIGEMAGFSSRGPVRGFGQVKPDVVGPGVNVLAAVPRASLLGALAGGSNYGQVSGTSMASPHVAGAAALVKQAHLGWDPDMVRTALINTATNLRDTTGAPKPDGADAVLDQGGGLIDVFEAVNAKALMGVVGDGLEAPTILGSHSFGEVPVVNSRVVHTESVEVAIRDVSGEGGTYGLRVANNRDLQLDGIDVSLSATSVPADGTFTVNASVDGDLIRDVVAAKVVDNTIFFEPIQMQFYVIAERDDGGETLRMPFYLKPTPSVPAEVQGIETETFEDIMPAGDNNLELVENVTFKDFPIEIEAATFRLQGDLTFDDLTGELPDLDLFLRDPDGEVVASSTNPGGPEHITFRPSRTGTFTWRVTGFENVATEFRLDSSQELGNVPPILAPFSGDFTDSQGRAVDFDGKLTLSWTPQGSPLKFEVERSIDGGPFETVATVEGETTSLALEDQPEGELAFRMRALFPGQIGLFVSAASAPEVVVVSRRARVNITQRVGSAISNVSFDGSVFQLDLRLTNQANQDFVPLVELNVVRIDSASGTVEVINADNGGSGTSHQDPALFDYSHQLGGDDVFSVGEATGPRTMRFRDEAAELFTFDVVVTAFKLVGDSNGDGDSSTDGDGGSTGGSSGGGELESLTSLLRFTVNPLTGSVTIDLIEELL